MGARRFSGSVYAFWGNLPNKSKLFSNFCPAFSTETGRNQQAQKNTLAKGAACRRCQCARRLSTIRYFPDPPGIGTATQRLPACGSWYHRYLRDSQQALFKSISQCGYAKAEKIAPSGRELSPQVTEGASGGELTVCFGAVLAQDCPFPMPILPGALVSSEQEARQSWGSTASGRQIGCVPAGSLRLGAAPQATSLRSGGIAACHRCQCVHSAYVFVPHFAR